MASSLVPALLAAGALLAAPAVATAQVSGCSVLPGTSNVTSFGTNSGRVTHMSTPRLRCVDGRYIEADSLVHYEVSGYTNMLGRVVFRADGRELRAAEAQYFENIGRLEAEGDVRLRELERGTVITGQDLLYLRAGVQRPQEQLTVTGDRPRAVLYPRRDTLRTPDVELDSVAPYEIVADRIYLVGDQFLQAQGTVGVVRDSLLAFSDSLSYDQVGGALDLVGRPARVVEGELDLSGNRLRILLPGDVIEEVTAREDAVLDTDSLDVTAPFIRIFMAEGVFDRLVASVPADAEADAGVNPAAVPAPTVDPALPDSAAIDSVPPIRARAVGNSITMDADSLDVIAPAQRLERMTAIGSARAVSTVRDTLNTSDTPEDILHDWIEGDTVRAAFAPQETEDGTDVNYVLESLEARLNARSLYRLEPDSVQRADTTAFRGRLPVNYTEADGILLFFADGEVTRMEWVGLRRGIQLQPARLPGEVAEPDEGSTG
ncbi:MAG: hypothetical protein HKO98_08245, partial [Gemmatimonadetes bacterium]|nr:hypothetical protein [Gemmatimonadota bacterium]